ncbi:MAG: hypothetical protein MHM6MM_005024 [Cercozoa sp. M6MM]
MSSAGVARLKEAEETAQAIIQEAREYRIQHLKEAKAAAAVEIEAFREQLEREQAQQTSEGGASSGAFASNLQQQVAQQQQGIRDDAEQYGNAVVDLLMHNVCRVSLKVDDETLEAYRSVPAEQED